MNAKYCIDLAKPIHGPHSLQKFRTFDASSLSKKKGEVLQGREGTKYLIKASA